MWTKDEIDEKYAPIDLNWNGLKYLYDHDYIADINELD